MRGKHQIVFGGEWVQNQLNISNAYESNGIFTFSGIYSASGPNGRNGGRRPRTSTSSWAPRTAFQQSKEQQNALRAPIPSLYIQDTYHATNAADRESPVCAGLHNSCPWMSSTVESSSIWPHFLANKVSSIYPNAPAGTFYYGDPGVPRQFTKNSPWQFSPNVGLSFDPFGTGKTVVRAGSRLGYDQVNFFTGQRNKQNPPFATAISQTQTTTSGPISFTSPWSVGAITTNPFPQPRFRLQLTAQFFPQSQYIVSRPLSSTRPIPIQWTASVQQ